MSTKWTRTTDARPEHGRLVDWIAPSGEQVDGGRYDGMWFLPPDHGMYCYYTPTYWRYTNA